MGWLEDAQNKLKELESQKTSNVEDANVLNLEDEPTKELLEKELSKLYENATQREIKRAIDYGIEKLGNSCSKTEFFKTVRIKLED